MDLYYDPLSTHAQKVLIALHEKDIAFERRLFDLTDPAARAAYEAIHPLGKVPALKPYADQCIHESTIIIEYLEGHHATGTKLIPDGIDAARKVRGMDRICDLYLNDAITTLLFSGLEPEAERNTEAMANARRDAEYAYAVLDDHLVNQDWLCGHAFTMADCAAIPPLFYAQHVLPFSRHASLVRYWHGALQRPSYRRVLEEMLPFWTRIQQRMGFAAAA